MIRQTLKLIAECAAAGVDIQQSVQMYGFTVIDVYKLLQEYDKYDKYGIRKQLEIEIVEDVCNDIEETEFGTKAVCERHGLTFAQFYKIVRTDDEFVKRFQLAREIQCDTVAESCIEIADDSREDIEYTDKGPRIVKEVVNRSALRIKTRQWLLSKLHSDKYGDKIQQGNTGGPGNLQVIFNVPRPDLSGQIATDKTDITGACSVSDKQQARSED